MSLSQQDLKTHLGPDQSTTDTVDLHSTSKPIVLQAWTSTVIFCDPPTTAGSCGVYRIMLWTCFEERIGNNNKSSKPTGRWQVQQAGKFFLTSRSNYDIYDFIGRARQLGFRHSSFLSEISKNNQRMRSSIRNILESVSSSCTDKCIKKGNPNDLLYLHFDHKPPIKAKQVRKQAR